MSKQNWRKELDPVINTYLNNLVKETKEYNYAISKSKDKSKAQLWIAMAILNNKLNNIIYDKKINDYKNKIPKEELNKIVETLEKL
jgi:hypothetical protein